MAGQKCVTRLDVGRDNKIRPIEEGSPRDVTCEAHKNLPLVPVTPRDTPSPLSHISCAASKFYSSSYIPF